MLIFLALRFIRGDMWKLQRPALRTVGRDPDGVANAINDQVHRGLLVKLRRRAVHSRTVEKKRALLVTSSLPTFSFDPAGGRAFGVNTRAKLLG